MIVETLRTGDHSVFKAYDGQAALELTLALRRVDLLITNTSMPGIEGPELIRRVRERLPTLPILYVKNLDPPATPTEPSQPKEVQTQLPPDVPILVEPFTPEHLLATVLPLLRG